MLQDSFVPCMSPSQRVAHVSHSRELGSSAQNTRDMHGGTNSLRVCGGDVHVRANSSGVVHVNSGGAVVRMNPCNSRAAHVRGGTKAMCTSTRFMEWRPAVGKHAFLQQASGRMHGEARVFFLRFLSHVTSTEVDIQPGCAVFLLCSLLLSHLDREVSSWIGWTPLEKTTRSGVRLFRGALKGERVPLQLATGSRRDRTPQRGRSLHFLRVLAHARMGRARLSGHDLVSGAGHCSLDCGGLSRP